MLQQLQKLYKKPIIPVIRINGYIDHQITKDVQNGLDQINPHLAKAVAVVISSPSGSLVQADIIIQKLQNYAKLHKLPLYTFAEELTMSSGYYILSAGDKVYADQTSQIGFIGSEPKYLGLKEERYEQYKFSNEKDLWYHRNEDLTNLNKNEEELMKSLNQKCHDLFIKRVQNEREIDLKDSGIINKIIYGEQAQQLGLVDSIGNFNEVLANMYPRADVVLANQKNFQQKFHLYMSQALQIIKQVNKRQKEGKSKLESNVTN
ncbi:hypothetical protein PPERSA_11142 [Pseudocohnilembus persalinus]|uniref:Peptidase S49 domain-containing protein n=1 Tax=Pseudocohnilembus persalinus TaxID=266149 RepID=A0A0V0QZ27_PSEPJ|nr:hypothetical protein PPERSA_11142 [Pseudocohnilembus persalinus]|eukprot:KRX07593.1 hypothetical protein PPERSA_11142 [Pseudocohnilembus persalinus]